MSGCEVDVRGGGGGGLIFNYIRAKLKVSFLQVKTIVSITLRCGARKRGRALKWMVLCVVLAVGPLPPHVYLTST